MNHSDRLHEQKLGQVNPDVKKVELSYKTGKKLRGDFDNEPLDPKKFPVLSRFLKEK